MSELTRVAIDTSKSVFTLHGVDAAGRAVLRRNFRRHQFEAFFEKQPAVEVVLEACGGSHHWGRWLARLGHRVRLIPPQYVKPFVKRGKNDRNDAEAICVAASQPSIGEVPVKTAEAQAQAMLLSARELLVRQRTQLVNALRGHATELGLVAPVGDKGLACLRGEIAAAADELVPRAAKQALTLLGQEIDRIEARLSEIDVKLKRQFAANPLCRGSRRDTGHRADHRLEPRAAGRPGAIQVRPAFRRLARPGAARAIHRRQAAAGRDQPRRQRAAAAIARRGRHRGDPARQTGSPGRLALACGIAQAPPAQARRGRLGQQDGPHRVGQDDER